MQITNTPVTKPRAAKRLISITWTMEFENPAEFRMFAKLVKRSMDQREDIGLRQMARAIWNEIELVRADM